MPILTIILQILSALPVLIQTAEQVFSSKPSSGEAKKQLVMNVVTTGVQVAAGSGVKELQSPTTQKAITDAAGALTDGIVAAFNAAAVFRHERSGS